VGLVGAQREDDRVRITTRHQERGQEQLGGAAAVGGLHDRGDVRRLGEDPGARPRGVTRHDRHDAMRGCQPCRAIERALERRRPASGRAAGEDEYPDVGRHARADGGAVAKESNVGDH